MKENVFMPFKHKLSIVTLQKNASLGYLGSVVLSTNFYGSNYDCNYDVYALK